MELTMRLKCLLATLTLVVSSGVSLAQDRPAQKIIQRGGDVFATALPLTCLATALIFKDYQGLKQGAFGGITAIGVTQILKYSICKPRPDGSNNLSFPSMHTAFGFAGAAFLQRRYGWKWGIPTYALATYVGFSRIYAYKHDIWDVLAGAAIGAGSMYAFTRPLPDKGSLTIVPTALSDDYASAQLAPGFSLSIVW